MTQRLNDENVVLSESEGDVLSKTISQIQTTIEHVLNNLKPFFVCIKRGQFLHNVGAPFVTKVGVKVQQLFLTALATKLRDSTELKKDPHRSHVLQLLLLSRLYLDLKKVLSHIESHLTLLLSLADQHKFNDFGVHFNHYKSTHTHFLLLVHILTFVYPSFSANPILCFCSSVYQIFNVSCKKQHK